MAVSSANSKGRGMDENTVRASAEKHGAAVVAKDFDTAGADLTGEAQRQAPDVMKALPRGLKKAQVLRVAETGDLYEVYISYESDDSETIVISTWQEKDGVPKIVNLSLS